MKYFYAILSAILVSLWLASPVLAAITVIDNFNSYTDGDLTGQGGWSGNVAFDVQGTTAQEGAKAIQSTVGAVNITKSITALSTDGDVVSIRLRNTDTLNANYFDLQEGVDVEFVLRLDSDGIARLSGATDVTLLNPYLVNTWYQLEIELDFTNDRGRARLNGGAWSTYVNSITVIASIDGMRLRVGSVNTGSIFQDNITLGVEAAGGVGGPFPSDWWFFFLMGMGIIPLPKRI